MALGERKLIDTLGRGPLDSEDLEGQRVGGVDEVAEGDAIPSKGIVCEVVEGLEARRHEEGQLAVYCCDLAQQGTGDCNFEEQREFF